MIMNQTASPICGSMLGKIPIMIKKKEEYKLEIKDIDLRSLNNYELIA